MLLAVPDWLTNSPLDSCSQSSQDSALAMGQDLLWAQEVPCGDVGGAPPGLRSVTLWCLSAALCPQEPHFTILCGPGMASIQAEPGRPSLHWEAPGLRAEMTTMFFGDLFLTLPRPSTKA